MRFAKAITLLVCFATVFVMNVSVSSPDTSGDKGITHLAKTIESYFKKSTRGSSPHSNFDVVVHGCNVTWVVSHKWKCTIKDSPKTYGQNIDITKLRTNPSKVLSGKFPNGAFNYSWAAKEIDLKRPATEILDSQILDDAVALYERFKHREENFDYAGLCFSTDRYIRNPGSLSLNFTEPQSDIIDDFNSFAKECGSIY